MAPREVIGAAGEAQRVAKRRRRRRQHHRLERRRRGGADERTPRAADQGPAQQQQQQQRPRRRTATRADDRVALTSEPLARGVQAGPGRRYRRSAQVGGGRAALEHTLVVDTIVTASETGNGEREPGYHGLELGRLRWLEGSLLGRAVTGQAVVLTATPDEENGAASEVEFAIAAPIKPGHVRLGVLYARGVVAAQELDLGGSHRPRTCSQGGWRTEWPGRTWRWPGLCNGNARSRPYTPRSGSFRQDRHLGSAGAQPQGHRPRAAPRRADRHHRPLRVRQVEPCLRHALRGGPAPLRRVALVVRAAVPGPDGEARCRLDRGPLAGDLDRSEDDLAQPAVDGRDGHRDLRLPPPAVGPDRPSALLQLRRADPGAVARADHRPRARAGGGDPLHGDGAGRPRAQGRVRAAAGGHAVAGLRPRARRRRASPAGRGDRARQEVQARHLDRRRPTGDEGGRPQAPRGVDRGGCAAGRRADRGRRTRTRARRSSSRSGSPA